MIISVVFQTIYLFMAESVAEITEVFNIYCSITATVLKTMNFLVRFRKIMALKETVRSVCKDEGLDDTSKEFLKDANRGYNSYRSLLALGWFK